MYTVLSVFTSHKEVFKELFLPSYQLVLLKYTAKANIDYPELFSQSIFYFQISKFLDYQTCSKGSDLYSNSATFCKEKGGKCHEINIQCKKN